MYTQIVIFFLWCRFIFFSLSLAPPISLPAPFTIPLILVNSDSSLFIIPTPLHYYCYLKSFPLLLVVNLVKPDEREDPSLLSFVIFSFSLFFFAGCVLSTFFRGDWARVWRHLRFEQVPRALLEMHHRRNEINIPNWILNSYCVWCVFVSPAEFLFFLRGRIVRPVFLRPSNCGPPWHVTRSSHARCLSLLFALLFIFFFFQLLELI